jgi:holo-[acyl-carrier protein] synthase
MIGPVAIRVGIDLTSVKAVQASVQAHGDRYLSRVYTDHELEECELTTGLDLERLASRFAVKEAAMKILRPDESDAIPWNTIATRRSASGGIDVELTGPAASAAGALGLGELTASLTHEEGFAAAVVIGEVNAS